MLYPLRPESASHPLRKFASRKTPCSSRTCRSLSQAAGSAARRRARAKRRDLGFDQSQWGGADCRRSGADKRAFRGAGRTRHAPIRRQTASLAGIMSNGWRLVWARSGCDLASCWRSRQQSLNLGRDRKVRTELALTRRETRGGPSPPRASYKPSTLLLTRIFTATRRFCALPSSVSLLAAGSASAIPVGVSMR